MFKVTVFYTLTIFAVAQATYSIVATDEVTGQIGGAGASCVPCAEMSQFIYVGVPGSSVLHTQARSLPPFVSDIKDKAIEMMMDPLADLDDILDTMKEMDPDFIYRQYGIANSTTSRGYTGPGIAETYATDFPELGVTEQHDVGGSVITAANKTMTFHALANIVSNGTVDLLVQGFENSTSEDIAERLVAALRSAVEAGAGDMRCLSEFGTSAAVGFVHVDNPDGTEYIHLSIIGNGETEPTEKIQKELDEWNANGRKNKSRLQRLFNRFISVISCRLF